MGQRSLQIHSAMALWIHSYFDNVMMKFMISNRTDMWETDVNLLNLPSTGTVHIIKLPGEGLNAFTLSSNRLQIFDEDKLGSNSFIGETCVTLKIFHSKPSQSLKRSLVARASVSMKFSVCICFFFFLDHYINKWSFFFPCISVPFFHWWIMKKFDDGRVCHLRMILSSFGVIWIRISDSRSLRSWCIKGTHESALLMDSSVPLMLWDPSDLASLILTQITPKEHTLRLLFRILNHYQLQ